MKSKSFALAAMYAMGASLAPTKYIDTEEPIDSREYELLRARMKSSNDIPQVIPSNPKVVIPKGHQLFIIDGVEVYALNMKNAIKKLRKSQC